MAATKVQDIHADVVSNTTISVTLGSTPTPGNLLVAVLTSNNTVTTPTHPWGGTPDVSSPAGAQTHITSKVAGASEPTTITFTNGTARNLGLTVTEFAATTPGSTWSLDKTASTSGVTVATLAVGPTATLTNADDVAVAGIGAGGSIGTATPTLSGLTVNGGLSATAQGFAGYAILAAGTALSTTGTWTTARNCGGALSTYKQVAPVVTQNSRFLALL